MHENCFLIILSVERGKWQRGHYLMSQMCPDGQLPGVWQPAYIQPISLVFSVYTSGQWTLRLRMATLSNARPLSSANTWLTKAGKFILTYLGNVIFFFSITKVEPKHVSHSHSNNQNDKASRKVPFLSVSPPAHWGFAVHAYTEQGRLKRIEWDPGGASLPDRPVWIFNLTDFLFRKGDSSELPGYVCIYLCNCTLYWVVGSFCH